MVLQVFLYQIGILKKDLICVVKLLIDGIIRNQLFHKIFTHRIHETKRVTCFQIPKLFVMKFKVLLLVCFWDPKPISVIPKGLNFQLFKILPLFVGLRGVANLHVFLEEPLNYLQQEQNQCKNNPRNSQINKNGS